MRSNRQPRPGPVNWPPILRAAAVVIVVYGGLIGAGFYYVAGWVPDSTIVRLPGATPDDVRNLLGESAERDLDEQGRDSRWEFRRLGRLAFFNVDFDDNGRVCHYSYDR